MTIERRDLRPEDVAIRVSHCGICHSDLHFAHNDWGMSLYPMVPGHEIVGTVTAVGSAVTRYREGDRVAVGCLVDSCLKCPPCSEGEEHFCVEMPTFTYSAKDRQDGSITFGGYAESLVVREEFVCRIPDGMDMARAAPLLCAGITTYSPLRQWKVKAGDKVAVAGLGGLGHMAVKLATAMGAEVTVLTTSPSKADAARAIGARDVLVSTDEAAMRSAKGRFTLIIDTIPVKHDVQPYLALLQPKGQLVIVGQIGPLPELSTFGIVFGNKALAGSQIGGIRETQEMLDFCAEHDVMPEIEVISPDQINEAWDKLSRGDTPHRFVIEMPQRT
ncbi:NAD(P)-dependent alcohol dehydrogenase [Sphingomonas xanthus]|uniref:NAD(P)-dependent alcohol dehydrogenase n=2 Tax=Sphingomonas xanthus TaxID=2594473 RepID=A0A516IUH5_9SPHN|nr:NAD(P)-dependent alcohol dehydrogenase [Sphingomonas xanthus]